MIPVAVRLPARDMIEAVPAAHGECLVQRGDATGDAADLVVAYNFAEPGRGPIRQGLGGDVPGDQGAGTDDGAVADGDSAPGYSWKVSSSSSLSPLRQVARE